MYVSGTGDLEDCRYKVFLRDRTQIVREEKKKSESGMDFLFSVFFSLLLKSNWAIRLAMA